MIILIINAFLFLPSDANILKLGSQDTPAAIILGSRTGQVVEQDPIDEPVGGDHAIPIILPSSDSILVDPPLDPRSEKFIGELLEIKDLQANLTAHFMEKINYEGNISSSVRWNEIARSLVIKHRNDPPMASRVYALVSVAQYDGMIVALKNKYHYSRSAPSHYDPSISVLVKMPSISYPSEDAIVAAASAAVLTYLYPEEAAFLEDLVQEQEETLLNAGANFRSDIISGDQMGRMVAKGVIEHAKNDGSDIAGNVTPPMGPAYWQGDNPLRPLWYAVSPWTTDNITLFRPGPPPSYNSTEFMDALTEVRNISDTRTEEQLRISEYWADGSGTYTPPGHWNAIACDLIMEHNLDELESARALAVLNIALMDAGISCWDTKYHYWLLRPWMADPEITTPIGRPPFPSYTSGHATFSGAASIVLSCIFPAKKDDLLAMADEAAISRLYGGIHYRFDNDRGLESGRMIGRMAIQMVMNESCSDL
ncbi:MAG: phosphatase PAP2 family protein [Methanothrix sp.]|nr:phosphatase PAP2 family protein [Methanothrix sp.]